MNIFAEKLQIVPLRIPQATTTAEVTLPGVRLRNSQWLSFLCYWGALTSDSTDIGIVRVYSSTAATSTAGETAIPFKYRLSSAVGGDQWGAITQAVAADGVTFTAEDDNKSLLIEVDPASIARLDSDAEYAYLKVDGSGLITNPVFGAHVIIQPRYPQNANLTST